MVRRRRAVGGMVAALVLCLLIGTEPGLQGVLWLAAVLTILLGAYLALLVYLRYTVADRERRVVMPLACDWSSSPYVLDRWAITRFLWAGVAGGLLQVVIALTQSLVERQLIGDGSRQAWLDRSLRLQTQLRRQSVRVLFVSATAAAGATAASSLGSAAAASTLSMPVLSESPPSAGQLVTTYTVREGDTLAGIAGRFGATVFALAAANDIADPNLIYAGQVLRIGAPAAGVLSTAPTSVPSPYTAVAGDTLGVLAERFDTTVAALAAANQIADPNLIEVGQVLVLDASAAVPTTAGVPTVTAPAPVPTRVPTTTAVPTLASPTLALPKASASPSVTTTPPATTTVPTTTVPTTIVPTVSGGGAQSVPSQTGAASTAVKVALEQVGKPYVWAGAGPNNFDCSGLVMYAWEAAGVSLPHYSVSQYDDTTRVTAAQLLPGDVVFYGGAGPGEPNHEAMYIGGSQVVAADQAGTDVRVESIDFVGAPSAYGRVA